MRLRTSYQNVGMLSYPERKRIDHLRTLSIHKKPSLPGKFDFRHQHSRGILVMVGIWYIFCLLSYFLPSCNKTGKREDGEAVSPAICQLQEKSSAFCPVPEIISSIREK